MDIIDIILGRATTSQSKMTSYANKAATAAASAAAAAETLENASEELTTINKMTVEEIANKALVEYYVDNIMFYGFRTDSF